MISDPLGVRLFDHLRAEFGQAGARAVGFFRTADWLLSVEVADRAPRLPEAAAYCLREAMKAIPRSVPDGGGGRWRDVSRQVVEAARQYERVKDLPGEDAAGAFDRLRRAVEELEKLHSTERIHQRRLTQIVVDRTGTPPLSSGADPLGEYQQVLEELDRAVHGDASREQVVALRERCVALLHWLFAPPEDRQKELAELAGIDSPTQDDVERLRALVATPSHLWFFLARIQTPRWLEALVEIGMLDPPDDRAPWPGFAAVERLARDHGAAVAAVLGKLYDRDPGDPGRARVVARAAVDVGRPGTELLLRVLREHQSRTDIRELGLWAARQVEPDSEVLEQLADLLLNDVDRTATHEAKEVVDRLVEGADASTAAGRIQLLCWKVQHAVQGSPNRLLVHDPHGSVDDLSRRSPEDLFLVLLRGLLELAERAERWLSIDELLDPLTTVPAPLGGRLRAWMLSRHPGVTPERLIDELVAAITTRDPTGDDLRLIDRVVREANGEAVTARLQQALGSPPSVGEIARRMHTGDVPADWLRASRWVVILPSQAAGPWQGPARVIAAGCRLEGRTALQEQPLGRVVGWSESPMSLDALRTLPVAEAAERIAGWRPDPSRPMASPRALASTLRDLVQAEAANWTAHPVDTVSRLRHPTYIAAYLQGVVRAIESGARPPADELVEVVELVRARPWEPEPLSRHVDDYDDDWTNAALATVDLLKVMADKNLGFAGRDDDVWDLLKGAVRDRSAPSGIISGAQDPLESAINRPCTRALEAMLSFMGSEWRRTGRVRREALALLEEVLTHEGSDGAEHRAIIATRLGFLRHVAPEWVDTVADRMFGAGAPDGLAQVTADVALKWGHPNRWLLERYPSLVRNAVARGVEGALEQLLLAMLWGVPGYGVQGALDLLGQEPTLLSRAGESLARLLTDGTEEGHLATAIRFWDAAIEVGDAESLYGFGWFAEVERLDDDVWASLMLATLRKTRGRIEGAGKVAERTAALGASETSLEIMDLLVRGTTDVWSMQEVLEQAVRLIRSADGLAGTREYERLRTALLERGAEL